jgi:hypothetical protein
VIIYHSTETGYGDNPNNLLRDVLLLNDGAGHFTDTGTTRMSATMLNSDFGTECKIVDMNGDGARGRSSSSRRWAGRKLDRVQQPATLGFFGLFHTFNP